MECDNSVNPVGNRPRLLVAEYNPSNYKLVEVLLRRDYDLLHAWNGKEAVALFSDSRPDLVLMDITMPNMDGLEALKAIRAKDSNANVVMCSAMGQEAMVVEAVQAGIKDFIVKPFKGDRLIKTVSSIVGNP